MALLPPIGEDVVGYGIGLMNIPVIPMKNATFRIPSVHLQSNVS
jgi:hypothetical protein